MINLLPRPTSTASSPTRYTTIYGSPEKINSRCPAIRLLIRPILAPPRPQMRSSLPLKASTNELPSAPEESLKAFSDLFVRKVIALFQRLLSSFNRIDETSFFIEIA
jgi:hypothetical protein